MIKNPPYLFRGDQVVIVAFGLILSVLVCQIDPPLAEMGMTQLRSVREMSASGQWLIPSLGGMPQLKDTPLSHWLLLLTGSTPTVARMIGVIVLTALALSTAQLGARVFGRHAGLLAGFITFVTLTFLRDISTCSLLLIPALCVLSVYLWLIRLENDPDPHESHSTRWPKSLVSGRSWNIVCLFGTLSLAAASLGVIAFSVSILIPLAIYVATSKQIPLWRSLSWCWGWLLVAVVGGLWPVCVWCKFPDVSGIWTYASWYEFVDAFGPEQLESRTKLNLRSFYQVSSFWFLAVPLGLWWTRHEALGSRRSAERILWCMLILSPGLAVMFLSHPRIILLSTIALGNILAAVGLERTVYHLLQWLHDWSEAHRRHYPVRAFRLSRPALAIAYACFLLGSSLLLWRDTVINRPASSIQLLTQFVTKEARDDEIIAVDMELGGDSTVALWEFNDRAWPLHNLSYLLEDRLPASELLIVTRKQAREPLEVLGAVHDVVEILGDKSLSAYRIKLHPELARFSPKSVRMNLAQSLHQEPGPWPTGRCLSSAFPLQSRATEATLIAIEKDTEDSDANDETRQR